MSVLRLKDLSVIRNGVGVVSHASLDITPGECVGLIGPNGAGKTSLMRAALGLLPFEGTSSLADMPATARAQHAAWLPQQREIAWPMSVERVIALGRIPHLPRGQKPGPEDQATIDTAMDVLGIRSFGTRIATELSGGEQARVLIARALAQDTPLLMADEPIAGLDPANQIATMRCFAGLAEQGRTVLVSLHDLGLAARHCTRLIMMHQGCIHADGPPTAVLTPENMAEVFGIDAHFQMTARGLVFQPMDLHG